MFLVRSELEKKTVATTINKNDNKTTNDNKNVSFLRPFMPDMAIFLIICIVPPSPKVNNIILTISETLSLFNYN